MTSTIPSPKGEDAEQEADADVRVDVEQFLRSMPVSYRADHSEEQIAAHAHVVAQRECKLVHVAVTHSSEDGRGPCWICVVTDDRPGLLAQLSMAIAAHSLDVVGAMVYCRHRPGQASEAVDLFAVTRLKHLPSTPLSLPELDALRRSMEALLCGETNSEWLSRHAAPTMRPSCDPETLVYMRDDPDGSEWLVVEADDWPGILSLVSRVVFERGLTIVQSRIFTIAERAFDEFQVARTDGGNIEKLDRCILVDGVYYALAGKGHWDRDPAHAFEPAPASAPY